MRSYPAPRRIAVVTGPGFLGHPPPPSLLAYPVLRINWAEVLRGPGLCLRLLRNLVHLGDARSPAYAVCSSGYVTGRGSGSTGAKDLAGNALAQDYSWTFTTAPPPETTAPRVDTMSPANLTTGVARGTSVAATFSEKMDPASITTLTFKLYKCPSTTSTNCTTQVTSVAVGLSTDGLSATLSPYGTPSTLLASKTKYKAVVTTGAKHVAGNVLDQNPSTAGNQEKVWYFATGRT